VKETESRTLLCLMVFKSDIMHTFQTLSIKKSPWSPDRIASQLFPFFARMDNCQHIVPAAKGQHIDPILV
jgi:hypothetical protein